MRHFVCSGVIICSLLLYSCAAPNPATPDATPSENTGTIPSSETAEQEDDSLQELKITILPDNSNAERDERIEELKAYLTTTLNIPVEFDAASSYEDAVEKIVNGSVDVAYLGPFTYIKAKEQNPSIEPIAAPIDQNTGRPWYTSVIIGTIDIQSLEEIKGRHFSFVSDSSTSGFLVPSYEFKTLGIDPETDFASVRYGGAHDKNLQLLLDAEVEAIAVDRNTYGHALEAEQLNPEKFHLIWESDPITNSPIVVSGAVPEEVKLALQRAFIDAPSGLVTVGVAETEGYTIVEDSDYGLIRKLHEELAHPPES
ncbi:phosphonate ABC transporter, periplasmic phosphonate-binding protein [[Leptolyngbya] sp. PCC 7376]|uniref:phosphate/phosphite/phosphonate ABC transporter substrate-binding protein n=1 Tax=[Leptolyngbya] sp. PCC 7376 TaxID=111781 RepID=UPI00029F0E44|nr:phosphate/phosphite/phosphonate ABC transporter substrate-binding protein [[Leptolyngbya] sp. PCC 7376]AFY39228.1 phosphonate ABC transporter, periplasmic phosphonate-binding protein [[Leptolyngbya] sp. PCC 7376]